ncbi:MAG TPA: serine/threonine-protein kinase [Gemmatimonadaceae bacterium]|nr:serine/threonine-protein kinase [Gemmatimonadaceae bacterium]
MATGSERRALFERGGFSLFTAGDAGVITVQRLATALSGRYRVERELGHGGAAFVFLATDLHTNNPVAVKVLRPELAAALGEARFHREIEIVHGLEHENILPLLDSGSADGLIYFTMPFIEGETLRSRLKRERQLPLDAAMSIAREVAKALDYAHGKGLVHRDIKPANILLDKGRVIVADFGIARAMKVASGEEITTASGFAIGTPEYMSPEQAVGQRDLDGRCDVYALGCVTYEMLVGEPPFTGPTAQAIIARHCQEPPHSIRVIRSTVPHSVERAIGKALAKVPADRYQTAGDFVRDLEQSAATEENDVAARISHRNRVLLAVAASVLAATGVWYAVRPSPPPLDRNRVVVFPLHDPQAPGHSDAEGEGAATYIGYALDGTRPLKWMDGWELLTDAQRAPTARLDAEQGNRISARVGAAFYIDGSIVRRPDSVTVILKLVDVGGDSVVRVAGKSGPPGSPIPQLSLAAIGQLLPSLVAPGGRIDLSDFTNRTPTAVANFLQGEREYRRMQFLGALGHYRSALAEDSGFTLAAVRGGYAANWESELDEGAALTQIALRHPASMSPAQVLLAEGLHAYLTGSADSSVAYLRAALNRDSTIHAGWTLLGEVYSRLLPNDYRADSLARDALLRARKLDPDFAPTLLLLEERALRDGNVPEVMRLSAELKKAGADTTHAVSRELMLRCVRDGPPSVDWKGELQNDEMKVLSSAKILSGRAAQPECAIAIYSAILEADTVSLNTRWAAFLGLQSQLAAVQGDARARSAFHEKHAASLPLKVAYPLVAAATGNFEREASRVADSVAAAYDKASTPVLWTIATWEAHRGNASRLRAISQIIQRRAMDSHTRVDLLANRAVAARLKLAEGDSIAALQMLRNLTPNAKRAEIAWQPWESLGSERLTLAQLLFANGQLEEARRTATLLDATEPLAYPLYLRQSLMLRIHIAEAMNNRKLVDEYQTRLRQLSWAEST